MSSHRDCVHRLGRVESLALTQIVLGIVGEVGCVRGQALVWSNRLEQEEFFKKKK